MTPWTVAHQAPLSMEFSRHAQKFSRNSPLEWVVISFSKESSWPRNWTHISCIGRQIIYHVSHQGSPQKTLGRPCSSAGKEFAHNAGDLGSIPRLWRSPPGRLPSLVFWPGEFHRLSIVSRRIRHDWATFIFTFLSVCLSLHQLHCAHVHSSHNRHALLG